MVVTRKIDKVNWIKLNPNSEDNQIEIDTAEEYIDEDFKRYLPIYIEGKIQVNTFNEDTMIYFVPSGECVIESTPFGPVMTCKSKIKKE